MEAREALALEKADPAAALRNEGGGSRAGRAAANDDDVVGGLRHEVECWKPWSLRADPAVRCT
jgi:hypothetical protein